MTPKSLDHAETLRAGAQSLGVTLNPEQIHAFFMYLEILRRWNRRINLTRITDPEAVVTRHFLDSLAYFVQFPGGSDASLLDLGAGAGFPGLPLKIVRPSLTLTLVESVGKKAAFLEHVVRSLNLKGVSVVKDRLERLQKKAGFCRAFEVVVARALAPPPESIARACPFVAPGGRLILSVGPRADLVFLETIARKLGFAWLPPMDVVLGKGAGQRRLLAMVRPKDYALMVNSG